MNGSLWNFTTRFHTTNDWIEFGGNCSKEGFKKCWFFFGWGGGFHFLRGSYFFSKLWKVSRRKEETFNCTVLHNRFVRSLTTFFCVCQKPILCQIFYHNPNSDSIKLEYCVQICPNCSRFDLSGRIRLHLAKQFIILISNFSSVFWC